MNISRRGFLQGAGQCAVGLVIARTVDVKPLRAATENFTGYPNRFGMLTDTTKCIGCRLCELACSDANGLAMTEMSSAAVLNTPRRPSATAWTVVNKYQPSRGPAVFRKVQCMHCDEPACVSSCLVGALKKTKEGAVIYDESVCIGCRYCMNACPFTMLSYEYDDPYRPAIKKCLMCYARISQQGGVPACAAACPTQATIFGKRQELLALAKQRIAEGAGKYVPRVYGETEAGGTGWLYLAAAPFEELGFPPDVGTTPYPEYTRDWLLGVPLVLMLWPALLLGIHSLVKHKEKAVSHSTEPRRKG